MSNNPVGWFEIYVQDMPRARKFYESVLRVSLEELGDPTDGNAQMLVFPMDMEQPGASGALVKMDGFASGGSGTLVYFNCNDCAEEAGRVVAAGGRIQCEKMAIGEYGFCAQAFDTEGNLFGLHSMQ